MRQAHAGAQRGQADGALQDIATRERGRHALRPYGMKRESPRILGGFRLQCAQEDGGRTLRAGLRVYLSCSRTIRIERPGLGRRESVGGSGRRPVKAMSS